MPRDLNPGEVGRADREKPALRRPPRTALFDANGRRTDGPPLEGLQNLLGEKGSFFFGDFHAPLPEELAPLGREFGIHPLALEDVGSRHQRPKIDVYGNQYFLVFYRILPGAGETHVELEEVDFFIGPNFLIVTHDVEMPLVSEVFERYIRQPERHDISGLLYEVLDALIDEYFPLLDSIAERSEQIDEAIFRGFETTRLQALLELRRDLTLLRRVIAPERDSINVLLRRDPAIIDPSRVPYFQDLYDHLIRVTDSIDSYRDLLGGSLDAFLSVENNRLSDVVRKLTIVSTIFLPLTFVTGFFGMNFERTSGTGDPLFFATVAGMALLPFLVLGLLRRKGVR